MRTYPLRISVIYFFAGAGWIAFSDGWLYRFSPSVAFPWVQVIKGLAFVLITAVLLYFTICNNYRRIQCKELEYSRMFRNNPFAMFVYDPETLYLFTANDAFLHKFGYKAAEVGLLRITDTMCPDHEMLVIDFVKKVMDRPFSDSGIWLAKTKDGKEFYAKISSHSTIFNGQKARMLTIVDVDEEQQVKKRLELSEKKLQLLIDNSNDFIYMMDRQGYLVNANAAFMELLKKEWGMPVLSMPVNMSDKPGHERWGSYQQKALSGESVYVETKFLNKRSGEKETYEIVMKPVMNDGTSISGISCFVRNITVHRRQEEQISEQLNRLKEINYMQSHELRSSLTNIMALTALMEEDPINLQLYRELLPLIKQCCLKMDKVIRNIVSKSIHL